MRTTTTLTALAAALLFLPACDAERNVDTWEVDGQPTFHRDVAPMVWRRCAECHREGQAAPFPLVTYDEVRRRAKLMLAVIEADYMPPWLPRETGHAFRDERRIESREIELLQRWVETGMPEGRPDDGPEPPDWPDGWQLGTPDAVVSLPKAFSLAAEGPDVFRNFVVRAPLDQPRYVNAVELLPGDSGAIHHALVQVDRTSSCRRLDAQDPLPGFPGMGMGASAPPDGHFIGWTPGKKPRFEPAGTAFELRAEDDLVLQLHLTPTGREEQVAPRIGLYFADAAPEHRLHSTLLFSEDIDLAPGVAETVVRDEDVLPTDVELLAVYPHAHYLGKRIRLTATAPDGTEDVLLRIDDWDFDWQDEYRYAAPVPLVAGTRLSMEWVFDNSADNPQNPHQPPRRVRYGLESADEMATLSLMLFPPDERALFELRAGSARHTLAKRPNDGATAAALGTALIDLEEYDEAIEVLEQATALAPNASQAWASLGIAHLNAKRADLALAPLEEALRRDDSNQTAHRNYGRALIALKRVHRALEHYKQALDRQPEMVEVRLEWANVLASTGRTRTAVSQYEAVLKRWPGSADVLNNLANTHVTAGDRERAVERYEEALRHEPDHADAHANLGRVLVKLGRRDEARTHLREALRLRPDDEAAKRLLRRITGS